MIYSIHSNNDPDRTKEEVIEGTGIRYIKARLEESCGKNWTFSQGAVADGWLVELGVG